MADDAGAADDADNDLARLRHYLTDEEHMRGRLRPSLRRLMELGPEAYFASKMEEREREQNAESGSESSFPSAVSMSSEERETLLSSKLVKLSPLEVERARHASYPIFIDGRHDEDDICRDSYLFDEIPFRIKIPLPIGKLIGPHQVYYHDEKIDWGTLEGWEVEGTKRPNDKGLLVIGIGRASNNSRQLEGQLLFLDYDELIEECSSSNQSSYYDEEDQSWESEGNERSYQDEDEKEEDDEEAERDLDDSYEEEEQWQSDENERIDESDDDEDSEDELDIDLGNYLNRNNESINETDSDVDADDEVGDTWESRTDAFIERSTFFRFDQESFVLDRDYENASWYYSHGQFNFGLLNPPLANDEDANYDAEDSKNTVTLFRVNESMAFARGSTQQFISLENTSNYGTGCGSHYVRTFFPEEDERHQVKMLQAMQAYRDRGSWIVKLFPSEMTMPEGIAHMILEYYQTIPPPFLFVDKGDLLLLARHEERIPDPDFPDMSATVMREHVVLAKKKDS